MFVWKASNLSIVLWFLLDNVVDISVFPMPKFYNTSAEFSKCSGKSWSVEINQTKIKKWKANRNNENFYIKSLLIIKLPIYCSIFPTYFQFNYLCNFSTKFPEYCKIYENSKITVHRLMDTFINLYEGLYLHIEDLYHIRM